MKRKIALLFTFLLVVAAVYGVMTACDSSEEGPSELSRSVWALYTGGGEDFVVDVERGLKEDPFIADGKVSDVKEFASITVTPLAVNSYDSIEFTLTGGEDNATTLSGTLTGNTYGEFSLDITLDFVPTAVTLTAGGQTFEYALSDVLEGALTATDAVNIAKKEFADNIAAEQAEGKAAREIYVKLITGDRVTYYYYVSFIGEGTDYWALLINPTDGTVVSKK